MAKRGTMKPLRILAVSEVFDWPEFQELRGTGHEIVRWDYAPFDLVLGPTCWRMDDTLRKYLGLAVEQAQLARYGKKAKNAKKTDPGTGAAADPE